ncbi:uncharacterized protein LOC134275617 [Saccostrea cucullata]|uniref:uncharacterized protein LOC134275617 n=1 Tax=Saccostrea cuccullata TaxID=36930 RepID=UPI002ED06FA2
MKLLDKIVAKDYKAVSDFDEMLKERFVEVIRDSSLRREIRRFSFEQKSMPFGEFRQTVLRWSEDYKSEPLGKSCSVHETSIQESMKTKVTKSHDDGQLSEILDILKLQQKQIDENQTELKKLSEEVMRKVNPQFETKPLQGRQFPKVKQSHLTCFRCGGKGHKVQDCSTQLENNNPPRKAEPKLIDVTKWMKVSDANHLPIPYIGYIEVVIDTAHGRVPNVGILVVKDTSDQYVYGSQRSSFVKVAGQDPIKIPANSMKVVLGTARQTSENFNGLVQAVHGNNGTLPKNILVIDTYADIENGIIPVRVVNIGDEDVWLNPKTRIGILHDVKVEYAAQPNCQAEIEVSTQEVQVHIENIHENLERVDDVKAVVSTDKAIQIHGVEVDVGGIISDDEKERLVSVLNKHQDVFSKNSDDLGSTDTVKHQILTTDEVPVKLQHRRIPPNKIEEVQLHIQTLLKQGIIRPSTSPYGAAVVLVRKKDGTLRLCVDYRRLNLKTIKDAFPIPRIEEELDALHGAKFFSTLDLAQGFYQVQMNEQYRQKTAFRVGPLGHVVSEDGVKVDPEKISVIKEWKTPQTEKELRSFLGLAGYYRKFIKGFSQIAAPLHAVLSKQEKKTKVLGFPNFSSPFIAETDASFDGLGAVLSQQQESGRVVIAYASRSLRPDCQTITTDKELIPMFPEYTSDDLRKLQVEDPKINRVLHWMEIGHKPTSR